MYSLHLGSCSATSTEPTASYISLPAVWKNLLEDNTNQTAVVRLGPTSACWTLQ